MGVPIILGVSGHRDLLAKEVLGIKNNIKTIIQTFQKKYPDTEIHVMTGLAVGADQLAANVALDLGCKVISVLPMPLADYKKDFSKDELKDFQDLLNKSDLLVELESSKNPEHDRSMQYTLLGEYLAKHSQALIAVWDGTDNGKYGGTAHVVKMALNCRLKEEGITKHIVDPEDSIMVYHIYANRVHNVNHLPGSYLPEVQCLVEQKKDYKVLYPPSWGYTLQSADTGIEQAKDYYTSIWKRINTYNKDSRKNRLDAPDKMKESKEYLLPPDQEQSLSRGLKEILNEYAAVDSLAIKYQKSTIFFLKWLLIFGVITFFWVGFVDEIYDNHWFLLMVPICFGVANLIYQLAQRKDIENKYYDYRTLAEGIRVQFFWKTAGLYENAYYWYGRKFKGEIGWIIVAIKNISLLANNELTRSELKKNFELARVHWIKDQSDYYNHNIDQRFEALQKQDRRSWRFFVLGIAFVTLLFGVNMVVQYATGMDRWLGILSTTESLSLLFIDLSFAIGAVFSGYVEKRQFEAEYRQFKRMTGLFIRGQKAFNKAVEDEDLGKMAAIIRELGIEALDENGDWITYNRSHSLELPT